MKRLNLSNIGSKDVLLEAMLPAFTAFPNLETINLSGISKYD